MSCSSCVEIDGKSRLLGEKPTTIIYTPEWPFGRYTYPAGGRFIRDYGQSAPLPEALTELQLSEAPAPVPTVAGRAYTAIGGKAVPYWGIPEMIEEAQAEIRPAPPHERAYFAELGRPRYGGLASLTADSIGYIEYWVGGQKVTEVRKGDQLEVRVVFTVASSGKKKLAIQRLPGGAYVESGSWDLTPGDYYTYWTWLVDYEPGSYTIHVDLYNDGNIVDSKDFPHSVSGVTPTPTTCEDITAESECTAAGCYWYDGACHSSPQSLWGRKFLGIPVMYWTAAGAVAVVGVAIIAAKR